MGEVRVGSAEEELVVGGEGPMGQFARASERERERERKRERTASERVVGEGERGKSEAAAVSQRVHTQPLS